MPIARHVLLVLMLIVTCVALINAALPFLPITSSASQVPILLLIPLLFYACLTPLAFTLHRPSHRRGGIALTLLFLMLWSLTSCAIVGRIDSTLYLQNLVVLLYAGIPLAVALLLRRKPWARLFSWTLGLAAATSAVTALLGFWFMSNLSRELMQVSLLLIVHGSTAAILLIHVGYRDRRHFRWLGLLAALVAFATGLATTIQAFESNPWPAGIHYGAAVIAMTCALLNLQLQTHNTGLTRRMQRLALAITVLTGAVFLKLVVVTCFAPVQDSPLVDWNRAATAALSLVIGSTLLLIISRERDRLVPATLPHTANAISLTCPNCRTPCTLGLHDACPTCLLQFKITLAEPLCPRCQRLLINLTSDRCPECGDPLRRPANPLPVPVIPS